MKNLIKSLFALHCILFFWMCKAETNLPFNELYFVSGKPQENYQSTEPVVLYRLNSESGTLSRIRTISTLKQDVEFIRPYYEKRILLAGSQIQPGHFQLDLVSFDSPHEERSVDVSLCLSCGVLRSYLLNKKNKLEYIFMIGNTVDGKLELSFKTIDLFSSTVFDSDLSDFGDVWSFGNSGGNVVGGDTLPAIFSDSGRAVYSYTDRINLGWDLPLGLNLKDRQPVFQIANNKQYRVIVVGHRTSKPISQFLYYSYDKNKKLWNSFKMNGDRSPVRVFGEWLVAETTYDGFKKEKELMDYSRQQYEAISNGKSLAASRVRKMKYIQRLSDMNVNQPGVLIIKNLRTGLSIELKADDEDAEILLVQDNKLVYREGSKIKIASIHKGELKKAQVIVDDERAGSIHWAFSG